MNIPLLTMAQIRARARILASLDAPARCEGCARAVPDGAVADPEWKIDAAEYRRKGAFDARPEIRCPECLREENPT